MMKSELTNFAHYFLNSPDDVAPIVEKMLGAKLKTKQTTGDGVKVNSVSFFFQTKIMT